MDMKYLGFQIVISFIYLYFYYSMFILFQYVKIISHMSYKSKIESQHY
ncbi:hypothetical protein Patl1_03328 [Pistacia atlantica]|uniref:Uncharacterized protein n=1 Tax=Pistacia atlantica TaxID=434234 RepID=A0ACC1C418_9ROSI|nr:hypothetical protein Patl1_03328 [Pistacia atlantica]